MTRPTKDEIGLHLAVTWSLRATCKRRFVGCVLMDARGKQIGSGYNGPAAGGPHCVDSPCPGAGYPSGEGLELCEAIHAEANALLSCADVQAIEVCYITHSPCLHCVKLLMNTSCRRIVFLTPYAHDAAARKLWIGRDVDDTYPIDDPRHVLLARQWRTWEQGVMTAFPLDLDREELTLLVNALTYDKRLRRTIATDPSIDDPLLFRAARLYAKLGAAKDLIR